MKKVVFILPGFFCPTSEYGYQEIGKSFTDSGYKVVYVDITWKYKRVADYIEQFQTSYLREKGEVNIFFGFSYGALIAYLSTPNLKPDFLYLCSMAPYFTEDLNHIPEGEKKEIGKRRWDDIEKYSFDKAAEKIICPVTIFFGGNEQSFVKRRVYSAKEKLKKVTLVKVPDTGHNISNDKYIACVQKEINRL